MEFFECKQEDFQYDQSIFFLEEIGVLHDFGETGDCSSFVEESNILIFHGDHIKDEDYEGMFDISENLDEFIISGKDVHEKVSFGDSIVGFVLSIE